MSRRTSSRGIGERVTTVLGGTLRDSYGATLRGTTVDVAVQKPAEGKEWSFTLPGGYSYRWVLGYADFVAGEQIVNREAGFTILDGDGNRRYFQQSPCPIAQFLTQGIGYGIGGVLANYSGQRSPSLCIPAVWLPGGWRLASLTNRIESKDQYQNVRLLLEQAYDPEPGEAAGELHGAELTWDQLGVLHAT